MEHFWQQCTLQRDAVASSPTPGNSDHRISLRRRRKSRRTRKTVAQFHFQLHNCNAIGINCDCMYQLVAKMATTRFFHSMAKTQKRRLFADHHRQRVCDSTEGKKGTSNLWCLRTDETIPVARPSRARRMAEAGRVKLVCFYTVNTKSEPTQKISKTFPRKLKPAAGTFTTSSRSAPTVRTIAGGDTIYGSISTRGLNNATILTGLGSYTKPCISGSNLTDEDSHVNPLTHPRHRHIEKTVQQLCP